MQQEVDHKTLAADTVKTAAALRSQLSQLAAASQILWSGMPKLGYQLENETVILTPRHTDLSVLLSELSARIHGVLTDMGIPFSMRCHDSYMQP